MLTDNVTFSMLLNSDLFIVSHFSQKSCLTEKLTFETIKEVSLYTLLHPCICHLLPRIKRLEVSYRNMMIMLIFFAIL